MVADLKAPYFRSYLLCQCGDLDGVLTGKAEAQATHPAKDSRPE